MKALLMFCMALTLSASIHADEGSIVSKERPVDVNAKFEESYFQTKAWINEFHYVIVVNKADQGKDAQSIKVYEFGKLIEQDKVSTGRDEFEAKGEHHSKRDSWSVTPTGYYTPSFLDKDHRSSAYGGIFSKVIGGTKMPFAIFFNGDIALHQAPKGTEGALGTKASGGCIRLPEALASDLFTRVSETQGSHNPRFTVTGEPMLDNDGHLMHATNAGFSTLVIVLKKVTE